MIRATAAAALCLLALLGAAVAGGPGAEASVAVGEVVRVLIESPPPYGDASRPLVWRHTIRHPGANFVKLHFARLALGPGDSLRVSNRDGRIVAEHVGPVSRGAFWVPSVDGEAVTLELRAHGGGNNHGVVIDRYGYGTSGLGILSTCFSDEKEDVACYVGSPIAVAARAVGRMIIEQNGLLVACTAFLISAQDHVVTNAHCIHSRQALDSVEVRFDYQRSACGGTDLAPYETFMGEELVLHERALDLAVVRLAGRPSAQYGYLQLAEREPLEGETLYVPQHAGAGPKKVSVVGCHASSVSRREFSGTEFGHQCDTAPGSSGSPVLDVNNEVLGVHRFGACTALGGENRAVRMTAILPLLPPRDTTLALGETILFGSAPGHVRLLLRASLRPGRSSDGVDPAAEALTVRLADAVGPLYHATVPAGSFRQVGDTFLFRDPDASMDHLRFARVRVTGDAVALEARASHLAFPRTAGPEITVSISIGDDGASQTVLFSRAPGMLRYLPH